MTGSYVVGLDLPKDIDTKPIRVALTIEELLELKHGAIHDKMAILVMIEAWLHRGEELVTVHRTRTGSRLFTITCNDAPDAEKVWADLDRFYKKKRTVSKLPDHLLSASAVVVLVSINKACYLYYSDALALCRALPDAILADAVKRKARSKVNVNSSVVTFS